MFLGIDLGTSELKLMLLADDHSIVATEGAPLTVSRPRPLWSEQNPADWWTALDTAIERLRARHPDALHAVRAIGLSGQMHGAVLLDEAGAVLRPAILWNDGRSSVQCTQLETAVPSLHRIAGNLAMPGFTAPKLLWVRVHEPSLFARVACVLLPKDYLHWRLTGTRTTDCSDASGTLWLDVGARRWSAPLLAACHLDESRMPAVREGSDATGELDGALADRWGLREGVVVAAGAGDNAASAIGIGAVAPGQAFVSLGTSGVIFACADRFLPNPRKGVHAFCHALPGRWHQMAVMLSAASALSWATQLCGRANEAELLALARTLSDDERERAPLFLPYLAGERTPLNNPHAQGALSGLTHSHGPGAIAHAVIEGVSFGLREGFGALDADLRGQVRELDLVGGGSRSDYWAELLAAVLERPLILRAGASASAALGAARLGWLAAGGDEGDVCRVAPVERRIEPLSDRARRAAERYERYRALRDALAPSWRAP